MSEEGPAISAADNEELKAKNEEKKRALRVVKDKLSEKQKDIRDLAPLVEEGLFPSLLYVTDDSEAQLCALTSDYEKAKTVIAEISSLSQQILDARLALTRSKQRHPEPRLTVSSASAQLDSQIMKMQESADELQGVNAKVSSVKEDIKAKSKQLEALRSQRAELEKVRSSKVDEVEDPRYAGLYDWCGKSPSPAGKANERLTIGLGTLPQSLFTGRSSAWKPSTRNPRTNYSWYTG